MTRRKRPKAKVGRRYHIKVRRIKQILTEASRTLRVDVSDGVAKGSRVEVVEVAPKGAVIVIDDRAAFIQRDEHVIPTLLNETVLHRLPTIRVDAGAVPYICNGADLMAPGVVNFDGAFKAGDIVVIVDDRFAKGIAVARTLYDTGEAAEMQQGKIAINLHFIGDAFWDAFKRL
jgi:PUA-domain protein